MEKSRDKLIFILSYNFFFYLPCDACESKTAIRYVHRLVERLYDFQLLSLDRFSGKLPSSYFFPLRFRLYITTHFLEL